MSNYLEHLIGKRVVSANTETGEMTLSDGSRLIFQTTDSECCSFIDLAALHTTDAVILSAETRDNEDETGGEGEYKAWVHVVTEAGELNIAEADGNASNGYYLHGFALDVEVVPPPAQVAPAVEAEVERLMDVHERAYNEEWAQHETRGDDADPVAASDRAAIRAVLADLSSRWRLVAREGEAADAAEARS